MMSSSDWTHHPNFDISDNPNINKILEAGRNSAFEDCNSYKQLSLSLVITCLVIIDREWILSLSIINYYNDSINGALRKSLYIIETSSNSKGQNSSNRNLLHDQLEQKLIIKVIMLYYYIIYNYLLFHIFYSILSYLLTRHFMLFFRLLYNICPL